MLHFLIILLIIVLGFRVLKSCTGCLLSLILLALTIFCFKLWFIWLGIALIIFLSSL